MPLRYCARILEVVKMINLVIVFKDIDSFVYSSQLVRCEIRVNERLADGELNRRYISFHSYSCAADNARRGAFLCTNNRAAGCDNAGRFGALNVSIIESLAAFDLKGLGRIRFWFSRSEKNSRHSPSRIIETR